MAHPSRMRRFVGVLAAVALPHPLNAQISLRAAAADVDNRLIGGMIGAAVFGSVPIGGANTRLVFGGEYLAGSTSRIGVPCGGFIPPGRCPPEPLRDNASSVSGIAGIRIPAMRSGNTALYLGGDLGLTALRSRTRGLTSGRRITADKAMWRADIVGEVEWTPPNGRFGLGGGAALGGLAPVGNTIVVDGYTPFNETMRAFRVWIGLSWRP